MKVFPQYIRFKKYIPLIVIGFIFAGIFIISFIIQSQNQDLRSRALVYVTCPGDKCYTGTSCPTGTFKVNATCTNPNSLCCEPNGPLCQSPDQCVASADCPGNRIKGGICIGDGKACCSPQVCAPNSYKCETNGDIRRCDPDGSSYQIVNHCYPPEYCEDGSPNCKRLPSPTPSPNCPSPAQCVLGNTCPPFYHPLMEKICSSGTCCAPDTTTECNTPAECLTGTICPTGRNRLTAYCVPGKVCCSQAPNVICTPFTFVCETNGDIRQCNEQGTGYNIVNHCYPPKICVDGSPICQNPLPTPTPTPRVYTCELTSPQKCISSGQTCAKTGNGTCPPNSYCCAQVDPPIFTCYQCSGNQCQSLTSNTSCTTNCNSCEQPPSFTCYQCYNNQCGSYTSSSACTTNCDSCPPPPLEYTCQKCSNASCETYTQNTPCITNCDSCPPPIYTCYQCNNSQCQTYSSSSACSTDCAACQSAQYASLFIKIRFQGVMLQRPNKHVKIELEKLSTPGIYQISNDYTFISDTNGIYRNSENPINNIPLGIYNLYISGPAHLKWKFGQITLSSGNNEIDASTRTLLAGDVIDDNQVEVSDYNQMLADLNYQNFASLSDLDFDGDVDIFDHNYLMSNYGKKGD